MKNFAKILSILVLISFFFACQKEEFAPVDMSTGDQIFSPTYGDTTSIYIHNGDVINNDSGGIVINGSPVEGNLVFGDYTVGDKITYNGNVLTWNGSYWVGDDNSNYMWHDESQTMVTITTYIYEGDVWSVQDGVLVNGTYNHTLVEGDIIYDESQDTFYEWNGAYWVNYGNVDNSQEYIHNDITNSFHQVINHDNSTTFNYHGDYVEINGSQIYNGDIIYDHSTEQYYEYLNNGVWITGDGNTYTYDNSTSNWAQNNYQWINNCCTSCPPADTIVRIEIDTLYQVDTVIIVEPEGKITIPVTWSETHWLPKLDSECFTGPEMLGGGVTFTKWGKNDATYGTNSIEWDAASGKWLMTSFLEATQETVTIAIEPNSTAGVALTETFSNCNMGDGPLVDQQFHYEEIGNVPALWQWGSAAKLTFKWWPNSQTNPALTIAFTQGYLDWMNAMGAGSEMRATRGWVTVDKDYVIFDWGTGEYILAEDFAFPQP